MVRKDILFLISFIGLSANTFAGDASNNQINISQLEASERENIINESTYRLDTKFTCTQTLNWDDRGSGADLDGYFYIPSVSQYEYIIGGYATQKEESSNACVITVSESQNNPENTPTLLVAPIDWKMIWKDKGSGARKDGSMWEAIPPDSNHKCLGSIPQLEYDKKPDLPNYRCVHTSLTEKLITNSIIWSDEGSGADKEVTMFRLPNTNSFIAVPTKISETEVYDLKANAISEPDQQTVDAMLSKRMMEIKVELESQSQAKLEQERLAKEAEQKHLAEDAEQVRLAEEAKQKHLAEEVEQKRLAKKAEQKHIAEKTEQVRLAEEAEQKHIAEKTEQVRLAEEAEQKRLADKTEQVRLAVEAEQKRLADKTEQVRLAEKAEQKRLADKTEQVRLTVEAEQKRLADKTEQVRLAEEAEQKRLTEELNKIEETVTNNGNTITDDNNKKSKGIEGLIIYFLKVFFIVIGLMIFLVIIFRFIKRSKNRAGS